MTILIATHNPAKFLRYKNTLQEIADVVFVSLSDLKIFEKVNEPYSTAKENALYKAEKYANLAKIPTLAIDESVRTNFLPENEQPGVYVRRFTDKNKEMTDEETLRIWGEILNQYPEMDKKFIWEYSIAYCNIANNKHHYCKVTTMADVADQFSKEIITGYPMSSFMVYPGTNKPHAALSDEERIAVDNDLLHTFVEQFKEWVKE